MIDDRVDILSGLLSGEIKPEAEANAAFFYLRGIELLDRMEPDRYALLREFDYASDRPISEPLVETLVNIRTRCFFPHSSKLTIA